MGTKILLCLFFLLSFAQKNKDYTIYCDGNCNHKIQTTPQGGQLMAGGGTDVDDGMKWMVDQSQQGDFVVLRTSGSDGYNQYLLDLAQPNSVTSIVFNNKNGASAQEVLDIVGEAEAIFFAGGDQSTYIDYWANTPLSDLLTTKIAQGVVFGGTSAGLAIQGQFIYTGKVCSVTSPEALFDPFNICMTFAPQFIPLNYMKNILTDSHFEQRDRIGRLAAFISRMYVGKNSTTPIGIGIDEQTNIAINADGTSRMFGVGSAFILTLSDPLTSLTCESGSPLTVHTVDVIRLDSQKGATWNFINWSGTNTVSFSWNVTKGVISSQDPYNP